MFGQGSPASVLRATARWGRFAAIHFLRLASAAVLCCAPAAAQPFSFPGLSLRGGSAAAPPPAPESDLAFDRMPAVDEGPPVLLRLRIAWGGAAAATWRGKITLSEGIFQDTIALGLEADQPGAHRVEPTVIHLAAPSPRAYDGVDVSIVGGSLDAELLVELAADEAAGEPVALSTPLRKLVADQVVESLPGGNRLLVRRAPGDALRVRLDRDALVLSPGQRLALRVQPHLVQFDPGETIDLAARLVTARTEQEVSATTRELRAGDDGELPAAPIELFAPREEGAYDVVLTLTRRRLRAPFVAARPLIERRVQFVVVDGTLRRAAAPARRDQSVVEIDPASQRWWERLTRLPQLSVIPGWGQGPLGNDRSQVIDHLGRRLVRLEAGGWQAFPLPVSSVGVRHVLEVEYPGDLPQTLGISILEPNAAGAVQPIGLDSGLEVERLPAGAAPQMRRHRLAFWPRTKAPFVLLVNRRENGPAFFGKLEVFERPADVNRWDASEPGEHGRMAAAYFDKPLFPENFSASEALDRWTGRALDDWQTFFEGGNRLLDEMRDIGYNAAVIAAYCEGSALYPSPRLAPTPKFDTGLFFGSGQDPLRKDVLEMLHRQFDAAGMTLLPAVQFTAPLPELERLAREEPARAEGLRWTDAEGRGYLEQHGTTRGMGAYYNALDDRVQQAMLEVVGDLVERYGDHPSFGGVVIQLGPTGFGILPGAAWGMDARTVAQFEQETGLRVHGLPGSAERARYLLGPAQRQWLAWRAARLSSLYERMAAELLRARPDARLYLTLAEALDAEPVQQAMRPALPRRMALDEGLLEVGLDVKRLAAARGVVLVRPHRLAPASQIVAQAVNIEVNESPGVDRLFAEMPLPANQFFHEPQQLRLAAFDAVSPFGAGSTYTWLAATVSPEGAANRRRFVRALAAADAHLMLDGGWMIPLGQERELRGLLDVYRRLPARRFTTWSDPRGAAENHTQPVVIRTLSESGRTWLYLVNDSPWPATAELRLDLPPSARVQSLDGRPLSIDHRGRQATWRHELRPYDLAACVIASADAALVEARVTVPDAAAADLAQRIRDLDARLARLRRPDPLAVLSNPGFEPSRRDARLEGWIHATDPRTKVLIDERQPYSGAGALYLETSGPPAWVRSEPFAPPKTGRIHVWVWLRTEDAEAQPPLRLAIEGRRHGRVYYRFAAVGAGAAPLETRWTPFVFQLDDLPAAGLEELRVGFDLMGPGKVWIDDVQVFDLAFSPGEVQELGTKILALADYQLRHGKVGECHRLLEGYWPRFLEAYVPAPADRLAERTARSDAGPSPRPAGSDLAPPAATAEPAAPPREESGWSLDRFRKRLTPRWPNWF